MNFISRMEGSEIQVELKYCERCGGLWPAPARSARSVLCRLPRAFRSDAEPRGAAAAPSAFTAQSAHARNNGSKRRPSGPGPD